MNPDAPNPNPFDAFPFPPAFNSPEQMASSTESWIRSDRSGSGRIGRMAVCIQNTEWPESTLYRAFRPFSVKTFIPRSG